MFPKIPYDERGKRFYYSCFFLTLFKFMSFLKRLSLGFAIFSLFTPLFFISTEVYAAPPSASSAAKFTIGERVQVSDGPLNVRAKASPSGKILGTQPTGALGTIVDGPKSSGGYKWWSVNYDTGADGWSAENYLISAVIALPSVPAYLFAAPGDTIVGLGWTASTGATSYTVKRSTTNGGPYTAVATGLTGTSHADTGLTNGTTYYYVVSAVNADGESANSAQASVTPFAMVVTTGTTPLGWWKLDGNASDSGSGGNTGTLTGSPTWVAGRSDQAMHLSSTANMTVSALNNASFPASGTLTFWIKTDNPMTTGNVNLFDGYASTRNHVFIRFTGVGKIQAVFQRSDGTYVTVFDLTGFPQTTWAHVAVVWNTATDRGQVYVNGALLSDKAINDATWTPNQQTVLFRDAALGTYDDIRLYNTALTASEVTEVYNY